MSRSNPVRVVVGEYGVLDLAAIEMWNLLNQRARRIYEERPFVDLRDCQAAWRADRMGTTYG